MEFCKSRYELDYQNLENVHKKSENEIVRLTQDITEKERSIEDLQTRLVESQSSYNIQIEELKARQAEELEQFKQKAIDELRSDGFYLFKKATEALEESRERILRENSERVKVVTTYAVMELTQFGFSPESYAFIQHKVFTFAETGGKFDKSEQSIIVNPCKNEVARKYGRKKKINKIITVR